MQDTSHTETPTDPDLWSRLTEREKQIALELARGHNNRTIAAMTGISVKTVDTHRGHVLKKLLCRGNVDLCRLTIRLGLTTP